MTQFSMKTKIKARIRVEDGSRGEGGRSTETLNCLLHRSNWPQTSYLAPECSLQGKQTNFKGLNFSRGSKKIYRLRLTHLAKLVLSYLRRNLSSNKFNNLNVFCDKYLINKRDAVS